MMKHLFTPIMIAALLFCACDNGLNEAIDTVQLPDPPEISTQEIEGGKPEEEIVPTIQSDYESDIIELHASYYPYDGGWFYNIELAGDEYILTSRLMDSSGEEYSEVEKTLTKEQVAIIRDLILTDKLYKIDEFFHANKGPHGTLKRGQYTYDLDNYYITNVQYSNGSKLDIKWRDDKTSKIYSYLFSLAADLLSEEEFVQLMKDQYGMTDADFERFDYDDFVLYYSYLLDRESQLRFNYESFYESYRSKKENEPYRKKFATELISIPSTDEEYSAFVKAYFEKIGKEYTYDVRQGLDEYTILSEWEGKEEIIWLYIGKTENLSNYISTDGKGYTYCIIWYPDYGDPPRDTSMSICYSSDGKFFLGIDDYYYGDFDYIHELYEVFTEG